MKRLLALVALCLTFPQSVSALPHQHGILTVGDRQFFVGEVPASNHASMRNYNFRDTPWLKQILDKDPVLWDQEVRFFRTGDPALDLVTEVPTRGGARLEDNPMYVADGHDVINIGNHQQYIYPQNSPVKYDVFCTRSLDPPKLNICDIGVAYPHGTHILLKARKYFPGTLPEVSKDFEAIAIRLVEIATCLDVTDSVADERPIDGAELLERHPDLSGCETQLIS